MPKPKKRTSGKPWRKWAPFAAVALIVPIVVAILSMGPNRAFSYVDVTAVGGDTLVLVGNTGDDTDTRRYGRVARVGTDGAMTYVDEEEEGALRFLGISGEVIWLDHRTRRAHGRRVNDLALIPGTSDAIDSHPVLSHRYQVEGVSETGLMLRGADSKRYLLTETGEISIAPADVAFTRPGRRTTTTTFDDPPGTLVQATGFAVGQQTQELRRVTTTGDVLWTATSETLLNSVEIDGMFMNPVWVGSLDGELWALIQQTEFHTTDDDDYSLHYQWLVEIDAQTGQAMRSVPLEPDE